ncbi:MAG: hypothetical protein PW786_06135 [Arachidicoccus sp.]|nr:hypothetical protein [Arachidicoccus sp.]
MAVIIEIKKKETKSSVKKKINNLSSGNERKFQASKFTGKIKSFGDGLAYQKQSRNQASC